MTFFAMIDAGLQALRTRRGLFLRLYLVELVAGLLFTAFAAWRLALLFAERPLFNRAVAGDAVALLQALEPHGAEVRELALVGLGWALGYGLLSFYLAAGLLGVLAGRGFGASARRYLLGFIRLWLLALLPYTAGALVAAVGVATMQLELADLLERGRLFGRPLLGLLPGLVWLAVTACAVDYARAEMIQSGRGSLRALLRGFRRALHPRGFGHYLFYLVFWLAMRVAYVEVTIDVMLPALLLFALRQLVCAVRLAARIAVSAGQLAAVAAPTARSARTE